MPFLMLSRYILLTPHPTSLNYISFLAGNEDWSDAKLIWPYSQDEDQEDAAS